MVLLVRFGKYGWSCVCSLCVPYSLDLLFLSCLIIGSDFKYAFFVFSK